MAYVCTSCGEQIQLRLVGSMRPGLHTSFDGETIALDLHYWQAFRSLFGADRRPSFELYGQWRNPNLVLDDRGSLAVAFMPDGSVNRGHLGTRSEPVTITLHEGSFSESPGRVFAASRKLTRRWRRGARELYLAGRGTSTRSAILAMAAR